MRTLPRVGDRVTLPWGLTEVEGQVVDAYSSGNQPYVTIDVPLEGTDEPVRVTYPIDVVRAGPRRLTAAGLAVSSDFRRSAIANARVRSGLQS